MRLLPTVRCMYGPTDCRWVGIRPNDRHIVKQLPRGDRHWDGNIRAWVTPRYVLATLPQWLEAAGYQVVVVDVSRTPAARDWHAEYKAAIGHPCKHKQDKQAADRFAANEQEIAA